MRDCVRPLLPFPYLTGAGVRELSRGSMGVLTCRGHVAARALTIYPLL